MWADTVVVITCATFGDCQLKAVGVAREVICLLPLTLGVMIIILIYHCQCVDVSDGYDRWRRDHSCASCDWNRHESRQHHRARSCEWNRHESRQHHWTWICEWNRYTRRSFFSFTGSGSFVPVNHWKVWMQVVHAGVCRELMSTKRGHQLTSYWGHSRTKLLGPFLYPI